MDEIRCLRAALVGLVFLMVLIPLTGFAGDPAYVATVKHLTRVNILESNNVSLRPGSIYDNATYFESLLEFPRPGFNYEFLDSGLGAAEPLYPMFQKGHQGSWWQLLAAMFGERNRHIDHFTNLDTPEGCRVQGLYLLRDLNEYPETMFVKERMEGYTLVVVRLEHYMRLRPDAQCGRHRAYDFDPAFDPMEFFEKYKNAMYLTDFPQKDLWRFEAKLSVIYHIKQEMNPEWPKIDLEKLKTNSLWYYPQGHTEDYDINARRPQPGLQALSIPKQLILDPPAEVRTHLGLERFVRQGDFSKLLDFVSGKPTPDFDPAKEPGGDTLRLSDVTPTHFYTSGLELEPILHAYEDVSDMRNYKLVGMTIKPYEEQTDSSWNGVRVIPQIRFVYQLMDPKDPSRPFEQFYLHLKYDTIDRYADRVTRDQQHLYFLKKVDELAQAKNAGPLEYEAALQNFITEFTQRPMNVLAFSSSMTGIWVFGNLIREKADPELHAARIVRNGIDVGYYSTTYDNDIFRAEIEKATGPRKAELQKHMDDITVRYFRDPKRNDPHAIDFNRMTCAQCHQTSGRDGVHMALNDGIDRRITTPFRATEYMYIEANQQLITGMRYWDRR